MSVFPNLGRVDSLPGVVRRSDLEERIRQLGAARADAWSLAAVPYTAVISFQGVSNSTTQGGRRVYFRPRNPQQLTSLSLRISGGGSEVEYLVKDDLDATVVLATTNASGDVEILFSANRTYEADTDYFLEIQCSEGTWSVDDADLTMSLSSIGLVPPADLELGVKGPVLPAGGRMMAADWNTFFTALDDDAADLVAASSFYQMRFACMILEPTNSWTNKDPRSYVYDTLDKFGGETVQELDVWACGSGGTMRAELDNSGDTTTSDVTPAPLVHGRSNKSPSYDVSGSGVGTPISVELTEQSSTSTLQRAYVVLHCRPLWE